MAFTVQDDEGNVANANAYITEAEFHTYVTDRGLTHSHSSSQIEKAIVTATDYIDVRFMYLGDIRNSGQSTEFPRSSLYDRSERLVSGIPRAVKEACSEYAFRALTATLLPDPSRDGTGQTLKSSKVKADVVESEKEFMDGGSYDLPKYPIADNKLRRAGFVVTGGNVLRA